MTLREKVFENLQHAKENGDFEPGGFLHGETVEQLADDMVAYAADVEDEDPKDLIPHIQAWLDQEGIQIK
ncbi:hypothetical protein [Mesorhizobium sp. M4B.F.Ca.ET.058.02.1.1]|uniref:hypothetical protein n=1 Tax=Mesorhizobium sp. M4B.F.Ca.ET.058.02.1.1 TaxID=2493675 RepID=UPI000F74F99F|nr:hypothetical protein [Mesorhizobium sp. M4B.F.Ca.ET.058.02.1.1]AZO48072.1 hypothetical protein EJ073_09765 [Mesorhizobium sp. M4B.F.Ca.ET.058.02.1.1]TJX71212.1 MAG: hypothetical protein E5W21_07705 [Mesorhizobium sp.]